MNDRRKRGLEKEISRIIGMTLLTEIKNDKIKTLHFPTTAEVSEYLKNNKHKNEVILFKASRSMKLETIIEEITK